MSRSSSPDGVKRPPRMRTACWRPCFSPTLSIRHRRRASTETSAGESCSIVMTHLAAQSVEKHRGRLVKRTGDGILATSEGPGRAVRCALALGSVAREIGLNLRAGLHTGEIEMRGDDIGGVAVHAAARVMAQSRPNEVLVSRVVTDLVAGAGLKFAERGTHELKGLPGLWDLFAANQ